MFMIPAASFGAFCCRACPLPASLLMSGAGVYSCCGIGEQSKLIWMVRSVESAPTMESDSAPANVSSVSSSNNHRNNIGIATLLAFSMITLMVVSITGDVIRDGNIFRRRRMLLLFSMPTLSDIVAFCCDIAFNTCRWMYYKTSSSDT